MPYNFYIDNKKEENIIKPYSQSQNYSELHTKDSSTSEPDGSGEIKDNSENETQSLENNSELKDNKENYNPNPQYQNQKSMDETNGTQSGEFFGNQTPQGTQTQSNSQTDNTDINQQQNQPQGVPNPQNKLSEENHSQATLQEQNSIHGDSIENMNQNRQPENEQAENETSTVTLIDADDLPPFKSEIWDMFQLQLKDKESFFKQKDYPRKPLMVDADLYSTLREIDIDNIAPTNLLNAILRTFIESFKEELRQFRKIQAPSVF